MKIFKKLLFFGLFFFVTLLVFSFTNVKKVEAGNAPYLSGIAVYVEDPSGVRIPGAEVSVNLRNDNESFLDCDYSDGKKTGPQAANYDPSLTGGVYLVDNVCCTVSGWTITVSKTGYKSTTVNVDNPWLSGQDRSTFLVNNGEYGWGRVVTLQPNETYTCLNNSTEQCQEEGTADKCLEGWTPTEGKTCPAPSVCCIKPPTTTPACGTECVRDADCTGDAARDGCTACLPGSGGKKVCTKVPTGTPPPGSTATPIPSATATPPPGSTATPTPKATTTPPPRSTPTPTPTPAFSEDMCKCDSLKYGSIVLGTPLNVTAFGKVEGPDRSYAKITGFTFTFFESAGGTKVNELKKEKRPVTVIEDTSSITRYKSDWILSLSPGLDTGKTYRIQAKPECSKKAAFFNTNQTAVLAAEDQPQNILDRFIKFFIDLFQSGRPKQTQAPLPTPTLTEDQKASLQLRSMRPATSIEEGKDQNNCTFIKFSF